MTAASEYTRTLNARRGQLAYLTKVVNETDSLLSSVIPSTIPVLNERHQLLLKALKRVETVNQSLLDFDISEEERIDVTTWLERSTVHVEDCIVRVLNAIEVQSLRVQPPSAKATSQVKADRSRLSMSIRSSVSEHRRKAEQEAEVAQLRASQEKERGDLRLEIIRAKQEAEIAQLLARQAVDDEREEVEEEQRVRLSQDFGDNYETDAAIIKPHSSMSLMERTLHPYTGLEIHQSLGEKIIKGTDREYVSTYIDWRSSRGINNRNKGLESAYTNTGAIPKIIEKVAIEKNGICQNSEQVPQTGEQAHRYPEQRQSQEAETQINDFLNNNEHRVESVDEWIDKLIPGQETVLRNPAVHMEQTWSEAILRLECDRGLPPISLLRFDGKAEDWPAFIERFHDYVHVEPFTNDAKRMIRLQDHLDGAAKRLVSQLGSSGRGYAMALQRLKARFGHPALVANAFLKKITNGPPTPAGNREMLLELSTEISDCILALTRIQHTAEIYAGTTVASAYRRLPLWLQGKWREHSQNLRARDRREPSLLDLEEWLGKRVNALFDPIHEISIDCNIHRPKSTVFAKPVMENSSKAQYKGGVKGNKVTTLTSAVKAKPIKVDKSEFRQTAKSPAVKWQRKDDQQVRVICLICGEQHPCFRCYELLLMSPEERLNFARGKKICLNCMNSQDHDSTDCLSNYSCKIKNCGKKHHSLLHGTSFAEDTNDPKQDQVNVSTVTSAETSVMLQILKVVAHGPRGSVETTALIDPGSQATLVREDLAEELGLEGESTTLSIGTIVSNGPDQISKRVSLLVSPANDKESTTSIQIERAWVVSRLNIPLQEVRIQRLKEWKHLAGVETLTMAPSEVKLLIGADTPEAVVPLEVKKGPKGQPFGLRTALGWTLLGTAGISPSRTSFKKYINFVDITHDERLSRQVEQFWQMESIGVNSTKLGRSVDDERASRILDITTKKVDGHYQTGLLWNSTDVRLPNNKSVAESRFCSLEKKLCRNDTLRQKYIEVMSDYIAQGHARKLSSSELVVAQHKRIWFLPHHAVTHPNKPGKVRIVFDAAARYQGTSLNDHLLTGPDLLNNLAGVLMRFRHHQIAVMADVKQMFHQVRVSPEDRSALRFIWRENQKLPIEIYELCVHFFGAKDSPCCASYALRKAAEDQRGLFDDASITTVQRNFYMDDWLMSFPTRELAIRSIAQVTEILKLGGFCLTKFVSTHPSVLGDRIAPEIPKSDLLATWIERALGMQWNVSQDYLYFDFKEIEVTNSKRGVLSLVSSIFDPLGILAPFLLTPKLMIQSLWKSGISWDEELSSQIREQFQDWKIQARNLMTLHYPRWYGCDFEHAVSVQLHLFSDASELALGAVAYLTCTQRNGVNKTAFLIGKSKLAPLKQQTIPRLELQAAIMGVRLAKFVKEEIDLNINETYYWTDSMLVLQYIRNESRRFHTYVANRVAEIHNETEVLQWFHVPGTQNPADDATRGLSMLDIHTAHRWTRGPDFLVRSRDNWPTCEITDQIDENDHEVRIQSVVTHMSLTTPEAIFRRFSSWTKLNRVVAWIIRYIHNLKAKVGPRLSLEHIEEWSGPLTTFELERSRLYLIRIAQMEKYSNEISQLTTAKLLDRTSSIVKLQPFLREGMLRVGGRLSYAHSYVPYEAKHQLILHRKHPLTDLIIDDAHKRLAHMGTEAVLADLRQCYWIPQGRAAIKKRLYQCFLCRRYRVTPEVPIMAPLPITRMDAMTPPFTNVGVDYFGPLMIKCRRSTEKRWVVLFTCMTTRGIHLELANSLSTDSFLLALRRFISRRPAVRVIQSDNGTNFVGADRELREVIQQLDQGKLVDDLSTLKITWKFNPPAAPHFGGVWERLVRSIKRALRAILGNECVHEDTLNTVLTEIESILNGRPLTPSSEQVNDYEALTPNHFLYGCARPNVSPGVFTDDKLSSRKRWQQCQVLANRFWSRWLKEYLPSLTSRPKWNTERRDVRNGDLVLIVEENLPRSCWHLGRVIEANVGNDGRVRSARVKTSKSEIIRPIAKLCVLEAS